MIEQSLDVDILERDALDGVPPAYSFNPDSIRSDIDVLDRFAAGLCPCPALSFLLSGPKKRCHDSLNGLSVCMSLSLRCLTTSLGTAYLFTPMADPRPAEISSGSSDSTSGSSTSSFSA